MAAHQPLKRLALVVHPTRPIDVPLRTLRSWAEERGLAVGQIPTVGSDRDVAPRGELESGDLVVALGGDGTVLSALRAAAPVDAPVLGVACGSLGALTAVHADALEGALERVFHGDWTARGLPALAIHPDQGQDEWAVNDFVVVRRGAGQVVINLYVDEELYVRLAGDGLIVATPFGSTAYSMAAGGPVLASTASAVVCTPVAMHGGSAPPLVVPASSTMRIEVHPSFAGFDVEFDGHTYPLQALDYRVTMHEDKVTLISLGALGLGLTRLRERGLVTDSPRVLARDQRASAAQHDSP